MNGPVDRKTRAGGVMRQSAIPQVRHDKEVMSAGRLPMIQYRNDVLMLQLRENGDLTQKTCKVARITEKAGPEHLNGENGACARIHHPIYGSHATMIDEACDVIMRMALTEISREFLRLRRFPAHGAG